MSTVSAQIVMRFAAVSATETAEALLARVGLSSELEPAAALAQTVDTEAYYDLLERAAGDGDPGLPIRYAESVRPDDFGALGLAFKTAPDVRGALDRLARYIAVLSDSLAYELDDGVMVLRGRRHHRPGARIANEGALAAITQLLRQITGARVSPIEVSFRHARPSSIAPHRDFFGCSPRFGAADDALRFGEATLATPARLADEGLSAFLLERLEGQRARLADRSLEARVHRAVADALCEGPPSRALVARRLGMSERTLHRRLADDGLSFRALANRARREVAESLLALPEHSLAEVAFLTGFSDQSAFTRAFKRWSGQTPLAYRQGA